MSPSEARSTHRRMSSVNIVRCDSSALDESGGDSVHDTVTLVVLVILTRTDYSIFVDKDMSVLMTNGLLI